MKRFFAVIIIFSLVSCASDEKIASPVLPRPPLQPDKISGLEQKPETPARAPFLSDCREDASGSFNRCGIEFLPFARIVFFDIDGDGMQEMIAGSKDGLLRLYKNYGTDGSPSWRNIEGYFDGIRASAFSCPAAGDIDNDGKVEIVLGAGGFSSESGRITIYRNTGPREKPVWQKIDLPEMNVGNDATPALVDVDNDGRPDIIAGNSKGELFLYRNATAGGKIGFLKDKVYFKGINLGMYVTPAAVSDGRRIFIVAGNSMGKVYLLKTQTGKKHQWKKDRLNISFDSFAAPALIDNGRAVNKDLVFTDGSGQFHYFKNTGNNFREWNKSGSGFFCERIFSGFASNPSISNIHGKYFMVLGNINGTVRFFEYVRSAAGYTWEEKKKFFDKIKLPGFSKGVFAEWKGKTLLITGQQDGVIRAFLNSGDFDRPGWVEQKGFFNSLPGMKHANPFAFDIDGDGKWELIVGDEDGFVRGFRYVSGKNGEPVWRQIEDSFKDVKVDRFAAPTLFRHSNSLYLLVGQQDGKVMMFSAEYALPDTPVFHKNGYLPDIRLNDHSAPSAIENNGVVEISIGDYNGNLKHFVCGRS